MPDNKEHDQVEAQPIFEYKIYDCILRAETSNQTARQNPFDIFIKNMLIKMLP